MPTRKRGMHLHQVLLQVKNVDGSREFYTGKLGFKLQYDFSPEYAAVLTPNNLQIGFYPFKGGRARARGRDRHVGIEFQVDHVDVWYQRLRKLGVRFVEKPKDAWGEREARFLDPAGYRLAISSPIAKHRG